MEPISVADRLVSLGVQASRFTIRERAGIRFPGDSYGAIRRPIAKQVGALADRLTRATVGRRLRPLCNIMLKPLVCVPAFRRRLVWRLSGLVYR